LQAGGYFRQGEQLGCRYRWAFVVTRAPFVVLHKCKADYVSSVGTRCQESFHCAVRLQDILCKGIKFGRCIFCLLQSVLDLISPLCNFTFTSGQTIEIIEILVRFKIERTCGTDPQQNPLTNAHFGIIVDFNSFKHSLQIWLAPTKNPGCSMVETTSTGKARTNKIQNGDMASSTDDIPHHCP
jgi:hypothetical protein